MLSKRLRLGAVLVGLALSLLLFGYLRGQMLAPPVTGEGTAFLAQQQEEPGLPIPSVGNPVRLRIPAIDVDAAVEYVGLTEDGAMDIPKNRENVAWFVPGPRPGEEGSAVVAGHYGWQNGKGSVFDDLHKLRKGDEMYVEDENGATHFFVVRESRRFDPAADATNVFSSDDGIAHLNLVTCEGVWDEATQSYSKRLVVFADRVD